VGQKGLTKTIRFLVDRESAGWQEKAEQNASEQGSSEFEGCAMISSVFLKPHIS
jgi:hypothetical protein